MRRSTAFISALGLVTPFGRGRDRFRSAIARGESAVSSERVPAPLRPWLPLAAGVPVDLAHGGDRVAEWLEAAAAECTDDDTSATLPLPERRALVFATTLGGLPRHLDGMVPSRAGAIACEAPVRPMARRLDIRGPIETINVGCASGLAALARAGELLETGEAETVYVAGSDALTRMTAAGFASLQVLAPDAVRPFDRERRGMALGEGAVVLRLGAPWGSPLSAGEGTGGGAGAVRPRPHLLGWGLTSDALHLTAPDPSGTGLARAGRIALARAGLSPEMIGGVIVSGTGTVQSDRSDAAALRLLFGDAVPPFTAPKSLYGHALGPAGLLDMATAVVALTTGSLPPTSGFRRPDPECLGLRPVTGPVPLPRSASILVLHSAFGGQNAAVAVRGESSY